MPATDTNYQHIQLNKKNQPVIEETKMKVVNLVLDKLAYGWSPEELQYQHPHLTLGQIYSALAYYADHQEEIDAEIENQVQQVDQLSRGMKSTPLRKKLKAEKLI